MTREKMEGSNRKSSESVESWQGYSENMNIDVIFIAYTLNLLLSNKQVSTNNDLVTNVYML